jgi:hypothetical protein
MSAAQAIPLDSTLVPRKQKPRRPAAREKRKRSNPRAAMESASLTLSGIADLPAAVRNVEKAVEGLGKAIATGATKTATVASNHGCHDWRPSL